MKPASALCFILLVLTGFCFKNAANKKLPVKKLTLIFHHQIGEEELVLGNPVKNILGETIVVQKFKYYVSNFSVTDENGKTILLPAQYYLVDEADSSTKKINLTIPDMIIGSIHFLLGVDSIKNVSGVQTGSLDPLKGMFWTWNSGYVMAKLEGTSASAATGGHLFTFDIGGFRTGNSVLKTIDFKIPKAGKTIQEINIVADINQWFKNKSEIRIAETPVCHGPGALAMKIADNYSTMFSINSIH